MNNITCEICGSNDFRKECGYYYCTECQTQLREVEELAFEREGDAVPFGGTTKPRKAKKKEPKGQVTSWECYNYVMLGLVNELIELGANESLKKIAQVLWFKYLKKIEVVHVDNEKLPKLQAFNCSIDAEIIYGHVKTRKRKQRSDSLSTDDVSNMDAATLKKERSSKKKALIQASYEEYASTIKSESSPNTQSLASIMGSSVKSSTTNPVPLQFARTAKEELKKRMSRKHLKMHINDLDQELKCHKLVQSACSGSYIKGPNILSRIKIYAILYLALIINKERIQLGDMIRFIHEGHLSYNNVNHFFPESLDSKSMNFKSYSKTTEVFTNYSLRIAASKIARLIGVEEFIPIQNLVALVKRYCQELNLPDQMAIIVTNLMSRTLPKMKITPENRMIPNYEGRAMSFIIFIMKLLFGLDNITEEYLSVLSDSINGELDENMFNFKKWIIYIEYRKLILKECHFPTQFMNNTHNIDTFSDFIQEYYTKEETVTQKNLQSELLNNLLRKLKEDGDKCGFNFTHTLTPFKDYLEFIINSNYLKKKGFQVDLIGDFSKTSMDFLLKSKHYLDLLNLNVTYIHRGINNIELIPIVKHFRYFSRTEKLIPVDLSNDKNKSNNRYDDSKSSSRKKPIINSDEKIAWFDSQNTMKFEYNFKRLEKLCKKMKPKEEAVNSTESEEKIDYDFYNPDERFWLLTCNDIFNLNKDEMYDYFNKFPYHFQLLLKECSRIVEQPVKCLLEEYTNVEVHLCYNFDVKSEKCKINSFIEGPLRNMLPKVENLW